ncbi:MAG: DUF2780 domain-containing protein [Planctomycetaceae bacterium]|nr:DUF2780 domain-containing protein [Planctomycetaceae bacterium]
MEQLNVDESQAKGGAGLIFDMLKQKLGQEEFAQVSNLVPQAQSWMDAAPTEETGGGGLMGMVGGLASQLGLGNLGQLAELAGGFKKLGLDASMISKFAPIIMKFVEGLGGANVKAILEKVLAGK